MITIPTTAWPTHHWKRKLNDCVILTTDRGQYNWIRKVNNKNRAYCIICREEFGIGYGGEGGVKAHMETEIFKSGMRQTSTSKSIKSLIVFPKDTHTRLKIVGITRTNIHYFIVPLIAPWVRKVTFPDSKKCSPSS